MSSVAIIFPHQLFEDHPAVKAADEVILVEEFLFFRQYPFHKQKLVFHRASMKAYQHQLNVAGKKVRYINAQEEHADIRQLIPHLRAEGVTTLHIVDPTDYLLERRLRRAAEDCQLPLTWYESPLFLLSTQEVNAYFAGRKNYFQTDFYIAQRKRFSILLDGDKPVGGKWSFDAENRKKYPKGKVPPKINFPKSSAFWEEAVDYVTRAFPDHPGDASTSFRYPIDVTESRAWLRQFLQHRFTDFGEYEDAIVANENILHHSLLTPMLNVGLLTPQEILHEALAVVNKNKVPLNSVEGFIRQIIGWREFIRGLYVHIGTQQRTKNYWAFNRKIPKSFWDGTTGIPPIDSTIQKILATGYCHHIERLMVLGNFMLLCEFDPEEVYHWFMSLFIDAYDWVMVPNVYGMSQFADGGRMATKPYISGSNYILKMSDHAGGPWQKVWDGLFWRFMHTHRTFFLSNPRLGMLVRTFDKMSEEKRNAHLTEANRFLTHLDV